MENNNECKHQWGGLEQERIELLDNRISAVGGGSITVILYQRCTKCGEIKRIA